MIKVNFFYLTLKTEYKLEFYLKYPDNAIRKLICQFKIRDHSLGIEKGRYSKIPRHLIKDFVKNVE